MKKKNYSHIRKWLWIYLVLIVFTTMATYLLIYQEMSSSLEWHVVMPAGVSSPEAAASFKAWQVSLQLRLLLLLTAGTAIICGLGFIWVRVAERRLSRPIGIIRRAVFRLASGKLNETVDIDRADEFGQIGSSINELAANLQELLLYIWKQTGQCSEHVRQIRVGLKPESSVKPTTANIEQLDELAEAIQDLRKMAKSYVFFDVRLEGEQTMAINEPGQTSSNNPEKQ